MKKVWLAIILTVGTGFFFWVFLTTRNYVIKSSREITFVVKRGESIKEIAQNLKKEKLIVSELRFYFSVFLDGSYNKLQAGDYLLNQGMGVGEIVRKFVKGEVLPRESEVTIIPGWTIKDINNYFSTLNIFQKEDIDKILKSYQSSDYGFLADKPKSLDFEGYLFPDTYRIFKDESLSFLIKKIFDNFDNKLTVNLRNEIKRQGKTIFEIITMASILEKEVQTFEDKKIVSGLLWKRLKVNMPLQVDATLGYITGKTSLELTKNDLSLASPYNTYTNRGLPKGPISNPSLESILAAIYPQESQFWFYLSANDGQTIFSKNFEDHKKAKIKYLR